MFRKILAESRLFRNLSRTVPYTKHPLLPADAAGTRPGHSATTIATAGDIPCVYPYAEFQRLSQTDERQTRAVAYNPLHRDLSRRLDLYLDAARHTSGWNSLPFQLQFAKHPYHLHAVHCGRMATRESGAPARNCSTPSSRTQPGNRYRFH